MSGNIEEASRWMKQAEKDVISAKNSIRSGDYEWACFQSQQAAEKALKAVLYFRGFRKVLTHSVFELLRKVENVFGVRLEELSWAAKVLDSTYISSRYPNAIAGSLAPFEYYGKEDAEKCVSYAESILREAKKLIEK
ncbi:MAG: HEPN domain-containing protein [Candidatus Jordarchaeales archaeon]